MIRVLLVDDQRLVRDSCRALLSRSSDILVVGQARDGKEAVELALELRPDMILMDIEMPRLNGIQATKQIVEQQSGAKVLMLTMSHDEVRIRTAMQCGAWGYLSKSDVFDELIPALRSVQAEQHYFGKTIREQYPHIAQQPVVRSAVRRHARRDPTWVSLNERVESARAEALVVIGAARVLRQESETLRALTHNTRELAHQLKHLRHPAALAEPSYDLGNADGQAR